MVHIEILSTPTIKQQVQIHILLSHESNVMNNEYKKIPSICFSKTYQPSSCICCKKQCTLSPLITLMLHPSKFIMEFL